MSDRRQGEPATAHRVGPPRAVAPRRQAARLVVPDVLRGLAIVAMLVAHGVPIMMDVPEPVAVATLLLNDLASPLFALVMGISAQLVLDRPGAPRGVVTVQQFVRGGILVVLGVWLSTWGSWVAIVLSYLGVTLIVGALLLLLATRWVIGAAAVLLVVSQPLIAALNEAFAPLIAAVPHAAIPAQWISLGGHYRLVNLLPMFLIGAVLLRRGLPATPRALTAIAAFGLVAFSADQVVVTLTGAPSASGTWADGARDLGLVAFAYVGVTTLANVRHPGARRIVAAVFLPLRACGSVALSLYVLQIALIAWWASQGIGWQGDNHPVLWLILVPGLMVVGTLWWRFVGLGPLEWLLGLTTGRYGWRR